MIGTLNTQDKRVTIVGAGVSGLLIGYALKKKGYQVTIHEKSNRCGGLIETKRTAHGLVETAAHSILVTASVRNFLDELGVELLPINKESKARYIYRNGKMRKIPLTFFEIISTIFHFFSKPKLSKPLDLLTLEEWGNAYLGSAPTKYLLGPFTAGIFACQPSELNTKLSFPKLLPESEKFSLFQHLRALGKKQKSERSEMMVFKHGTEDLIVKLQSKLKDEIKLNSNITDFSALEGNLILSTPAPELKYSPLVTATVFISKDSFVKKAPQGVGVLIPRGENLRMLGCLFNSSSFSNRAFLENEASLTVMYGGTADPSALLLTNQELESLINQELAHLLGAKQAPTHIEITKWQRAIPIYSLELTQYIEESTKGFCSQPGKIIFTNFAGQVSLRGMIETVQKI